MVIDGAHKSDFAMFCLDTKMLSNMLSTGQQKKLLMLFTIANARLLTAKQSTPLAILIDEAASHLDDATFKDLLARLNGVCAQLWMTGINAQSFQNLTDALFVSCNDGEIECKIHP
jgi:recombinational DNA repair ATPase RecF